MLLKIGRFGNRRFIFKAVVSNHILSVATFATIVATPVLLWPLLSEFESEFTIRNPFVRQLAVTAIKSLVATCGKWRQG
jgi:hypothetical protein